MLTLAQFKAVRDKIIAAEALAKQWGDWEKTATWTRTRTADLREQFYAQMTSTEQKLLDEAQQNVYSAWVDLWLATDADDLLARGAKVELTAAQDAVWRLLRHYPAAPPTVPLTNGEKEATVMQTVER